LNGFRSLLAPRAVIRDPLRLLDADRLAADEAGLAGAAVDPEPDGAERVAGAARTGGPFADQQPVRAVDQRGECPVVERGGGPEGIAPLEEERLALDDVADRASRCGTA